MMMMMMTTSESDDRLASDAGPPPAKARAKPRPRPVEVLPPEDHPPESPDAPDPPDAPDAPDVPESPDAHDAAHRASSPVEPSSDQPPDQPPDSAETSRNQSDRNERATASPESDQPVPDWHPSHTILSDHEWRIIAEQLHIPDRELAVIQQLFDGASEGRAAFLLGIKRSTVHTYIKRTYRRLGVTDQRELVLRIVSEFLSPE